MKKRWMAGLLALLLAAAAMTGCQVGNTRFLLGDLDGRPKYVFSLNGQECSREEAMIYLCNYKNLYGTAYGIDIWQYDFEDASLEEYVKAVSLAELTRIFTMASLAEEQNISLDGEERELAENIAREYYESLEAEEIDFMGIREKDVRKACLRYGLAKKLYHTLSDGVVREVSDDEARVIRVQQIIVTDLETAGTVSARLAKGDNFETLANSYNQEIETEVTVARGDYPTQVEEVAFNLGNNAYSDMIATENGYYFIKCLNKFEEELTEENKKNILLQREKQQFEEKYQAHAAQVEFVMNEEIWQELTLEGSDGVKTADFFGKFEGVY